MKKKITEALLAEAATRHFQGETLSNIAASLGIPENSLISAKNRRAGEWRQATDAARRAIAEEPIAELKCENAALKSENTTLKAASEAKQIEIEVLRAKLEDLKGKEDIAFPPAFFRFA